MTALSNAERGRLGGLAWAANHTPEERRQQASKAAALASVARRAFWCAQNENKADRLYTFLQEYISAKHYAPTVKEIACATGFSRKVIPNLLKILKRAGRIHLYTRARGITFTSTPEPVFPVGFEVPSVLQDPALLLKPSQIKCYECDNPVIEGKTRCEQHLLLARDVCKRNYGKRRTISSAAAKCVECSNPVHQGTIRCELHLRRRREACKRAYDRARRTPKAS